MGQASRTEWRAGSFVAFASCVVLLATLLVAVARIDGDVPDKFSRVARYRDWAQGYGQAVGRVRATVFACTPANSS